MNPLLLIFLDALFGWTNYGWIEIRLIEDKPNGRLIARRWFPDGAGLLASLPELMELAAANQAAVFFGVLRRRETDRGTAADVIPSRLLWADVDFKQFLGGEAEALQWPARFPLLPSIVVRSGHGLHLYWLLREDATPEELSALARRIASVIGGDSTHDAARILRLPETYNRKDLANPLLVEIEYVQPERIYNASEITAALDMVGATVFEQATARPAVGVDAKPVVATLSPRIAKLVASEKRARDMFNGMGKPKHRADGQPMDDSSSGYDFSFLVELARLGVRDADELAAAVAARPDGKAAEKGPPYIRRTVAKVLERIDRQERGESEEDDVKIDFTVQQVRVYPSTPATYEIVIDGKTMVLSSAQLRSATSFELSFMDTHHRLPKLPRKSGWTKLVNSWLKQATRVDLPPEATSELAVREEIERIVGELPVGDDPLDLDRGKAIQLEGGAKAFKSLAIKKLLVEEGMGEGLHQVCRQLRVLGYASSSETHEGVKVRVWKRA